MLNNLAVDALLVTATLYARRRKVRRLRAAVAVILGATVAVGYAVVPVPWQIVIRILLAPLMTLIFDKYSSVKDFFCSLAVFAALTFVLGGVVSGVGYLVGVELEGYLVLGLTAFGALALIVGLRLVVKARAKRVCKVCEIVVCVHGKDIRVKALCDSGNTLTDTVSGLPVMIASEKFSSLIVDENRSKSEQIEGFVELQTVSGNASLPIIGVDEVTVGGKKSRAYAALSGRNFDGYEIILQNTMF